jgi:hypothetical protein
MHVLRPVPWLKVSARANSAAAATIHSHPRAIRPRWSRRTRSDPTRPAAAVTPVLRPRAAHRVGSRVGISSSAVRRENIANIEASFGAERVSPSSMESRVSCSRSLMLIIATQIRQSAPGAVHGASPRGRQARPGLRGPVRQQRGPGQGHHRGRPALCPSSAPLSARTPNRPPRRAQPPDARCPRCPCRRDRPGRGVPTLRGRPPPPG